MMVMVVKMVRMSEPAAWYCVQAISCAWALMCVLSWRYARFLVARYHVRHEHCCHYC